MNSKLMKTLCGKNQLELKRMLEIYLQSLYEPENVKIADGYILCKGCIDIALVAHMDKVFDCELDEFYYDKEEQVMWSPCGAGFDDRAGIYAIIQLLKRGYRPHIILTEDEEKGGIGAKKLINDYPESPFDSLAYMIELDRANHIDCVFYDCANEDFTDYVEGFGFETAMGTFTDIKLLSPKWGVAAVNLSVGYYDEHTYTERLDVYALEETIEKVALMLEDEKHLSYAFVKGLDTCDFCWSPAKELFQYSSKSCLKICEKCYSMVMYRNIEDAGLL